MKYNDVINVYNYDLRESYGDGVLSEDEITIRDYLIDLYRENLGNKYIGSLTIKKIKAKIDGQGYGDISVSLALPLLEI